MNSELEIPIVLRKVGSLESDTLNLQQRIARRAQEIYLEGGEEGGHSLDNWLRAERELVIQPDMHVRTEGNHAVVVINVQNIDPTTLFAKVTPHEMLLLSGPGVDGRRVFRRVSFPQEIDLSDAEAEYQRNRVVFFANFAAGSEGRQSAHHVV